MLLKKLNKLKDKQILKKQKLVKKSKKINLNMQYNSMIFIFGHIKEKVINFNLILSQLKWKQYSQIQKK